MRLVFRQGMPYAVDVARLKEQIPIVELTEGTVIAHEKLSGIINALPGSGRYYGVINAWISQMKNAHGIFVVWLPTIGVKVLSPDAILAYAETRTRHKMRQTGKAIRHFAWVDRKRLDAAGQQRLDHQMRVANAIKDALTAAKRDLTVSLAPVASLPSRKSEPTIM